MPPMFRCILVKVEEGVEVATVGEFAFNSRPDRGDRLDVINVDQIEVYEVLGYRHTGHRAEMTRGKMGEIGNPGIEDDEHPVMLVTELEIIGEFNEDPVRFG
jgi:hypothetical protein